MKSINQKAATTTLMSFVGSSKQDMPKGIAYALEDHCELVDTTGRIIRDNNAGHI
ncbi:hypothetical protein [Paraglaciecola arctica]|uniref:hypothetical protein n=1 Tax=Paraglaciecola arctica TaxID=1128911 RepID=UPI001C0672D4|nr:hypothetical protein [Paraglaciecola arctica]MBU3002790.1 hypothetical protein [Paraglaciecola arctica]